MTVIFDGLCGLPYKPFHMTVMETPRGMLMREERFRDRILAREVSYDFIREIAESTLPFQNISNLLRNVVGLTEWTSDTLNLRAICEMVISACDKAADHSKPPCGSHNVMGRMPIRKAMGAGKRCLGYDDALHPGQDIVFVDADPDDWDDTGRGNKRFPHTYECILRPHMVEVYKKSDTWEEREAWEKRVDRDGMLIVMDRRVREARRAAGMESNDD